MSTPGMITRIQLLVIVACCLVPRASSPSADDAQNPATPVFPMLFEHRWPTEYPPLSTETGCGLTQPTVSAVLGEFRSTGGAHYHGGVDIPLSVGTSVYGVIQDLVFVRKVDAVGHQVGLRVLWTDSERTYYRYLHVNPKVGPWDTLKYNDEIVWDPFAMGRYQDPQSGQWKWPVHLPIAYVQDLDHDHLHFEENWWHPSNGWWIRFNPLLWLCPWTDTKGARIEDVAAYTGGGTRITTGQGTESSPWIVTSDFDLRVHAYDTLPNRDSNKAGVWNVEVDVRDPFGTNPLPSNPVLGPWFSFLPRQGADTVTDVNTGISYVYDVSASNQSDYYYWATNTYDEISGGTDWEIKTVYLTPYTKYRITASVTDWDWNWADDTVWVMYDDGTCYCPHQGDMNSDGVIDIFDVIALIGIAFSGGAGINDPWCASAREDLNCDTVCDVFDVIYAIWHAFQGGPAPCNPCWTGRATRSMADEITIDPGTAGAVGSSPAAQAGPR